MQKYLRSKVLRFFLTQETGDYGRDLIINNSIYVECKKFDENNSVGRPILQKLLGAMDMFNIEKGIVITTGKYSNTAKEAAKMSGKLILWDSKDLFKFLMADKDKAQKMIYR
ncbi:restriction endonuclease [Clostridium perfringens]|uniref:restriction endonuclease n=1 Tax=Clostridium perfringens TaxID=1502 RepID=UPI0024BCB170|nr:restriction endonuclease [Clostridium perfringens]